MVVMMMMVMIVMIIMVVVMVMVVMMMMVMRIIAMVVVITPEMVQNLHFCRTHGATLAAEIPFEESMSGPRPGSKNRLGKSEEPDCCDLDEV